MHKHHAEKPLLRRTIFSRIPFRVPPWILACGILGAFGLIAATLSAWLTVGSLLPFASLWIWWYPRMGVPAVRTQQGQEEQERRDTPHAIVVDQWPALHQSYLPGLPILRTQLNETAEQIERGMQETGHRLSELAVGIEAVREHLEHVQRIVKKIGIESEELQKCTEQAVHRNQALAEETTLARVEIQYHATINQWVAHIIDAMVELEYGLLAQGAGREAGQKQGWAKRLEQRFTGCVEARSRPAAVSRAGSDGQAQTREHQNQPGQPEGDVGLL